MNIFSQQMIAFKHFSEELKPFSLANIGAVDTEDALVSHFKDLR